MATNQAISLNENNDENVNVVATTNVPTAGTVLDLTGKTVEAFLKPSKATADADGAVWKGTIGSGVTVTDAAAGHLTVNIPAASVTTTQTWWRVDVLSGGLRKTVIYGAVTVVDL